MRFTVVLCTPSTGEKVKPIIILRTPQNLEFSDETIYVIGTKGGSMTSELIENGEKISGDLEQIINLTI